MRGSRTDFPILTCAASRLDGEYRTVIGARPARAIVLTQRAILELGGQNDGT